jgi:hypothetical protein
MAKHNTETQRVNYRVSRTSVERKYGIYLSVIDSLSVESARCSQTHLCSSQDDYSPRSLLATSRKGHLLPFNQFHVTTFHLFTKHDMFFSS